MIEKGQLAPDFEARTTDGRILRLSRLRGQPVVLYFFPKAFTTGCTLQAEQLRDSYPEIQDLGAEIVGVSLDDLDTQCRFAESTKAPFPMIGDTDKVISRLYGVLRLGVLPKRVTFVIDEKGIVRDVLHHEIRIARHRDGILQILRALRGSWLDQ